MKGKSLSKKAIIAIVIIAILVIAAISMVVVFLRDQGETEATAIGENGSNSEQTQDAVPNNNDDNNQGTATQSEEPQQEEQTTVANNDGATTTNVGTTTPATTTTTTDGSTQVATITTTETIPTQALTLAWSNMTVSGGELLANLDADVTDVTAPVRLATNILKFGESNELREYYVKRGDTIYMYIAVNEELAHNPTFTLINNGKEYVMEDSLVEVRQTAEDRWDYSVKYVIPEDTDFVDGEITLKVSDIEDKGGNIIPDEDGQTNGHRVFYDGTAPRIIVKGTEGVNEPDEQYIGDAIQRIFSKVSFKFSDNLMLEGEYEVNDTLITGMTPATLGDANFAVIKNYLKQGENTIRTWDMAGNEYTYTFIYDSIAPVYSKLGILNKTRYVNDVKDLTYAKRGDEVRILISFTEKLAVEPTVKVFGKEYTATYRPQSSKPEQNIYYYMVDITMDETMPEGEIPFEVYGYADIAGNVGEKLDQTKINRDDYTKVIYDRTKPVVRLEGTGVNDYFRSDVIITAEDANLGTIHLRKNGELIKNYELGTPLTEEGNYEVVMSDKAGNKSEQINFTIDKTAPVITLEGTGVNNNFRTDVKAIIEEANAHNIKYRKDDGGWITVSEKKLTFTEEGTYTIEVIDLAYNKTEVTFTIDKTAPVITLEGTGVNNNFRSDVKVVVEEVNAHNIKYRKDNDRWITVNEEELTFTEEGTYTIEVIDQAYNRAEVTFTIDKTAPVIKLEGTGVNNSFRTDVKATIEEADVHNIKYRKNSDRWITVNEKEITFAEEGTYTIEVIDKAYNKTEVTFTIDKTAPVIRLEGTGVNNNFRSDVKVVVEEVNAHNIKYRKDNDRWITVNEKEITFAEEGTYTVEVIDQAYNKTEVTFTIDKTAPVIKLEGTGVNDSFRTDVKATIEEADVHNIKYRKNSDRWITVNEKEITFTEEGTYTIEVIDQAYNRTEVTFTIDKTVPVIRLEGTGIDNDFRTNVKVVVEEANVHNIKYKDETGNWTTVNEKTFEITKEGTYTVEVIDKAYNKIEVTFSIDKTAPSIKPTADSVGNKDKNGTEFYSRIGFTVTDNYGIVSYDLNGDTEIIKDGDISYDTIKDYLKQGYNTITVTDKAGNPSSYTFYYDSKKPVPYSVRINSNSKFDKSYAKVDDEVWVYVKIKDSLSVEPKIKINDIDVDTFQNGSNENGITYAGKLKMTDDMKEGKVTFEVYGFKDLAGNEGDIITDEDINTSVIFDKTPATVALNGESSIEIEAGSIYNDQGATVVDDGEEISNAYKFTYANYYADPKSDKVTESRLTEINTRKTGLYKIAYIYIDKAGNSKQATRLLYVVDTTKPTIKLNGDENITIEAGTPYKDEGATVTDNSDDTIENFKYTNINYYVNGELKKSHLSEVDVKQPGEYRIGYQYTDKSGNTKIVVRTLIVKDTTNPVVKANGKSQTLKVGDKYEELGATVTDNAYINANDYKITIHYYDENGNLTYPAVDKVDTSKVGEYKIAYTAIDTSGNHSNVDVISIKITK